jgi:hypothetical protein
MVDTTRAPPDARAMQIVAMASALVDCFGEAAGAVIRAQIDAASGEIKSTWTAILADLEERARLR